MFYVYILFSKSRDMYYIGSTSMVVEERLRRHLSAHKGFAARAKDWEIVYSELFDQKSLAIAREQEIKKWKNKAKNRSINFKIGNGYRVPNANREGRRFEFPFSE